MTLYLALFAGLMSFWSRLYRDHFSASGPDGTLGSRFMARSAGRHGGRPLQINAGRGRPPRRPAPYHALSWIGEASPASTPRTIARLPTRIVSATSQPSALIAPANRRFFSPSVWKLLWTPCSRWTNSATCASTYNETITGFVNPATTIE